MVKLTCVSTVLPKHVDAPGKGCQNIFKGMLLETGCEAVTRNTTDLVDKSPKSRRVRVAGKLEMIAHSSRTFLLVTDSGQGLEGLAGETGQDKLAELWGKKVVVSGRAVYGPSGSVVRIEADSIQEAVGEVSVWSREPAPLEAEIDVAALHKPQGPGTGVNAIFGKWPGNESDEQIDAALKDLS